MSHLGNKTGLSSVLFLSAGNITGMLISALALILYSRYLGPTEFGVFSVAFAFMQIVIRLADFGTNVAAERSIARAYDDNLRATGLISTTLWLKAISYLAILAVLWLLSPWITHSLLHIESLGLIRSAIILSVGTIIFEYSTLVFQATHRFDLVARITIAQGIGKLVFSLILMWQGALTGVLGLTIYGLMPGLAALLGFIQNPLASLALPVNWRIHLKEILSVIKWTAISALALTVTDHLDILMVQSLMSSYDAGIWSGAVRIATFANLIGWSIGSVLNIRVARYKENHHLAKYLQKAWKIALTIFVIVLLTIPLAKLAIIYTIGSSYLVSLGSLQILLLSIAVAGATVPYIALFYVYDYPQYYALSGLIQIFLLIAGDFYAIPLFGLDGSAWVRVATRIILLIFTLYYARKSYLNHFPNRNL